MSTVETDLLRTRTAASGWRRAVAAMSLLSIATAAGAGMVVLTQILLARGMGPAPYGLFASSLATVTMIAPLAGFGLSQFWLKAYGVEGWAANRWLLPSLRFAIATTTLTVAALVVWSFSGVPTDATRLTLLTLLPVVLSVFAVDLVSGKLRLEERYAALALWQLSIPGSRLGAALVISAAPALAPRFVAPSYCAISLGVVIIAVPPLRAMLRGEIRLHGHGVRPAALPLAGSVTAMQLWSQAWAYGLAAVLYPIFFQISTVLLKYLGSDAQAGMFGIALSVMTAIYLIPATIYQKFLLSKLHRWAAHDQRTFWRVHRKANAAMLLAGILVGGLLATLAPWLVPFTFGGKYQPVVRLLLVLAVCPPIRFLSTAIGSALLTERHMRYRVAAMALATFVAVTLNLLLIPPFGEMGAAAATVVGEAALLLTMFLGVRRYHPDRYGPACDLGAEG